MNFQKMQIFVQNQYYIDQISYSSSFFGISIEYANYEHLIKPGFLDWLKNNPFKVKKIGIDLKTISYANYLTLKKISFSQEIELIETKNLIDETMKFINGDSGLCYKTVTQIQNQKDLDINNIKFKKDHELFEGIADKQFFFFVHFILHFGWVWGCVVYDTLLKVGVCCDVIG